MIHWLQAPKKTGLSGVYLLTRVDLEASSPRYKITRRIRAVKLRDTYPGHASQGPPAPWSSRVPVSRGHVIPYLTQPWGPVLVARLYLCRDKSRGPHGPVRVGAVTAKVLEMPSGFTSLDFRKKGNCVRDEKVERDGRR